MSEEGQVTKAFEEANKAFGDVRTYVNCAGIGDPEFVLNESGTYSTAKFKRVIDINLFGSFLCTSVAAWHLKKLPLEGKERGLIINTSSIASKHGLVGQASYGASKGGIEGMLLPIARELGPHEIRLMNISPGVMRTPIFDNYP